MANRQNTFLVKRSSVAGKVPIAGQLALGELALNTADCILYASGTTSNSILPIGWNRVAKTGDTMTGALTITAATNPLTIVGVQSQNDSSVLSIDSSGVIHKISSSTLSASTGVFVHISGDTMTGNLYAPFISATTISAITMSSTTLANGKAAIASGTYSHAEGNTTIASGINSHAEGSGTTASGSSSHAEGVSTIGGGIASHAEGSGTTTSGLASHSEGGYTIAKGVFSHAEGQGFFINTATTINTSSINYFEYDEYAGSVLYADTTTIIVGGDYSTNTVPYTCNYFLIDNGVNSFTVNTSFYSAPRITAISYNGGLGQTTFTFSPALQSSYYDVTGTGSTANGVASHVEGESTTTVGRASHAEGYSTVTGGKYSHAEGSSTHADGESSHAEGNTTLASGQYSHTEGQSTLASGQYSHAEGYISLASGIGSHAEGFNTTASGPNAHAEGLLTIASGSNSHAEGEGTIAAGTSQSVLGKFNTTGNTTSLVVIGNGTDDNTRSNLVLFDTSGVTINGILTVSGATNPVRLIGVQSQNDSSVLSIDSSGVIHKISSSTLSGGSSTDVRITGGTPNNSSKLYTFTNNTGGTFNVTALTDIFLTAGTPNDSSKLYTFTNSTGGTFNVTGLTDLTITGGTYNNPTGTATFTNNTGGTFNVAGFVTGSTTLYSGDGTLAGNRVVNLSAYTLSFSSATQPNTLMLSSNNIGIRTATPLAVLHVKGTTEQLRLEYDATHYVPITVTSANTVRFGEVGGYPNSLPPIYRFAYNGVPAYGSKGFAIVDDANGTGFILNALTGGQMYITDLAGAAGGITVGALGNPNNTIYNIIAYGSGWYMGSGYFSVGASPLGVAQLEGISIANPQLGAAYNSTNYATISVSSVGVTTFNAVGASSSFVFNDSVGIGVTTPSNPLHVSAATDPVRFVGLQSQSDSSFLTVDANGVVHITSASVLTGATTLYTGNGSLSGNRVVNIGTNTLNFSSSTYPNAFHISGGCLNFSSALMPNGDAGTSGYLLKSNGASTAPTWIEFIEGTYSATTYNTTNMSSSSASTAYYRQIGSWVHVWGEVVINVTTDETPFHMGFDLPFCSGINTSHQLAGTAAAVGNKSSNAVRIHGDTGNNRASFEGTITVSSDGSPLFSYHFSYKVEGC